MPSSALVEQLAGQHDAHLRWLSARLHGRLAPDEIEDVLQTGYARALTALSAPAVDRPEFARTGQAAAWLRRIALNYAYDLLRERHGRTGEDRPPRPAPASVDEAGGPDLVADVDVESEAVEAVQRDAQRSLVLAAIARLDARHRQILQLRYGQGLSPAAVMLLAGLDRRQWDGRHTRALKALGRALARLPVSGECRRTRILLRTAPSALLKGPDGAAGDHVASCLVCAAFSDSARFAMASLPLPLAIEPWRLHAVEVLSRPSAAPAPVEPAAAAAKGLSAALAPVAVVLATIGALAVTGLAGGGSPGPSPRETAPAPSRAAAMAAGQGGARLAAHLTPRQSLERSARDMARRRAAAGRRRSSREARTTTRPSAPARAPSASRPRTADVRERAARAPRQSSSNRAR